ATSSERPCPLNMNPYQSPTVSHTSAQTEAKTVRILPFQVNTHDFKTSTYTPDSLLEALHRELYESCRQLGLNVRNDPSAEITISGSVPTVDEGNQLLRYLVPFLAGASHVVIEATIQIKGQPARSLRKEHTGSFGAFGGTGRSMIDNALRRAAI